MPEHVIESFDGIFRQLGASAARAAEQLALLNVIITRHRERWLVSQPGQWPDEFVLLNRYTRTGYEPPFIFND